MKFLEAIFHLSYLEDKHSLSQDSDSCAFQMLLYKFTSLANQPWLESHIWIWGTKYRISHLRESLFSAFVSLDLRHRKAQKSCQKGWSHGKNIAKGQCLPTPAPAPTPNPNRREEFEFDIMQIPWKAGPGGAWYGLCIFAERLRSSMVAWVMSQSATIYSLSAPVCEFTQQKAVSAFLPQRDSQLWSFINLINH